jgi:dihydrofolate reductase
MLVSIIAAVAENGVIGRSGQLPWHLSNDLRRFKQLTMGHTVIMGRRTWESIGRPLPGRQMIVVSRQPNYQIDAADVRVVATLIEALQVGQAAGDDEVFVIGGAELYRAALPMADRLYLTRVHADVIGDTYFPSIPRDAFSVSISIECDGDSKNDHPHTFQIYERTA